MPNLLTRILLFLSSYAPLILILWVRNSLGNRTVSLIVLAVGVLSVIILFIYLALAKTFAPHALLVKASSSRDSEAMSYIVTYLLPFLGFGSSDAADRISLAIFLAMLAVLYISANLIHMNPMLNLFGYRVLEVESGEGKLSTLICRKHYIRPGTQIDVVSLSDTVLLEK